MTIRDKHQVQDPSQEGWVQALLALTAIATVATITLWSLG